MPRGVGKQRTDVEKEDHLQRIAPLHAMGLSAYEIADRLGVSHTTVYHDIAEVKRRFNAAAMESHGAMVQEKLAILREVRKEAYAAWERSKQDTWKATTRKVPVTLKEKPGGRRTGRKPAEPAPDQLREMFTTELTEVREGRLPASEYMNIILKTVEQERAILGLDEALKIDLQDSGGFWDAVARTPVVQSDSDDPIEAEIVRVDKTALPAHRNGDHR
jgi:AcrR family transcriptional regulator